MSITEAADENLAVHATWATRHLPNARLKDTGSLVLVDSGLPCDTFNFACRARLTSADAERSIRDAIEFFALSQHPFSWWLGPGAMPEDLATRLEEAGLTRAESELAMVLDLGRFSEVPDTPEGFEVRRVRSAADLESLATLLAGNWDPPDAQVRRYYGLARATILSSTSVQWLYLGLLDGTPVATAELTVGGGVVGLYNISTRADARGKGIGSLMTAFPLHEARNLGHTTAILQASDAGQHLYARLGFVPFGIVTEYKP